MKRFFTAVLFCLVFGSFIAACATTANDKRGEGGKISKPKPAQEEVVPAPADEAVPPQNTPSRSK